MQLREMQDAMARMRLSGQQNTEEYRKMAAEAANLSDTLQDLNTQTRILSNDDANLQGFSVGYERTCRHTDDGDRCPVAFCHGKREPSKKYRHAFRV